MGKKVLICHINFPHSHTLSGGSGGKAKLKLDSRQINDARSIINEYVTLPHGILSCVRIVFASYVNVKCGALARLSSLYFLLISHPFIAAVCVHNLLSQQKCPISTRQKGETKYYNSFSIYTAFVLERNYL